MACNRVEGKLRVGFERNAGGVGLFRATKPIPPKPRNSKTVAKDEEKINLGLRRGLLHNGERERPNASACSRPLSRE